MIGDDEWDVFHTFSSSFSFIGTHIHHLWHFLVIFGASQGSRFVHRGTIWYFDDYFIIIVLWGLTKGV